mmetsp:Transcript_101248/g.241467  ORF Transcript_101248/g.241467 Transcript_101248/m.241467 type:complete len:203 (+) Transcript_101248:129-737(+)
MPQPQGQRLLPGVSASRAAKTSSGRGPWCPHWRDPGDSGPSFEGLLQSGHRLRRVCLRKRGEAQQGEHQRTTLRQHDGSRGHRFAARLHSGILAAALLGLWRRHFPQEHGAAHSKGCICGRYDHRQQRLPPAQPLQLRWGGELPESKGQARGNCQREVCERLSKPLQLRMDEWHGCPAEGSGNAFLQIHGLHRGEGAVLRAI